MEPQTVHVDVQEARREALQGAAALGRDEIKVADPPCFAGSHKELKE